jgi:hypothetical protein
LTVQAETRNPGRLFLALAAIAGLVLALTLAVAPAFAGHTGPLVSPTTSGQATNWDCDDLVAQGFISAYDDQDESGDSPSGAGSDDHVSWNVVGSTVSFQADAGWLVLAVNVKGGQAGGNIYDYETDTLNGVDHDNGLVTPNNPSGQPAGISHIIFCLIETEVESESPSVEESESPEGSQLGGTGAPSVPDTAMSATGVSGPLATLLFGAILVASLGALAYANVRSVGRRS